MKSFLNCWKIIWYSRASETSGQCFAIVPSTENNKLLSVKS